MTTATAKVTVDDFAKIANGQTDDYNVLNQMERLTRGEPEGTMGRLLWQGLKEGKFDPARFSNGWWRMAQVPDAYDAELFLQLLMAIRERDKKTSYTSWSESSDLPGWPYNFDSMFENKSEDKAFFEALANGWSDVPAPYGHALAMKLAGRGVLKAAELPDEVLAGAAKVYLGQSNHYWRDALCWDEDTWSKALLEAALTEDATTIATPKILATLAKSATPEQMVVFAQKTVADSDADIPSIEAVGQFGEAIIAPLEAALDERTNFEPGLYNKPSPAFHLVLGYCRACQVAEKVPDPRFDKKFTQFVSAYRPSFSGGAYETYHGRMRSALQAIPEERLSQIMLDASKVNFELIGAAPTEEVARRAAKALAEMSGDGGYYFANIRADALKSFGDKAVTALCEALEEGAGTQREAMVQFLGGAGDDRAVPTLVTMLNDKAKGVREAAKASLLALSAEVVIEHLGVALGGRRKDQRLAAAEVLRAFPPSKAGFELAQAHVDSEKVADIEAILREIKEPGADAESLAGGLDPRVHQEVFEGLVQTHQWEKYVELGEGIAAPFLDYLGKVYHGQAAYMDRKPLEGFLGLLKAFPESALVRRMAIDVLGALSLSGLRRILAEISEFIDDFGADVARALVEGRIQRHPVFGTEPRYYRTGEPIHLLEWLVAEKPQYAWEAAIAGLQDSSKPYREACVAFVTKNPEKLNIEEDIVPLLSARTKDQREAAVWVLAELAQPEHLVHLEAALKSERAKSIKELLEKTIARITVQSIDLTKFKDDKKGNAALDKQLGEFPNAPIGKLIEEALQKIEAPKYKQGGAAMSKEAFHWFVGELCSESRDHRGETVRLVRERLADEDCHALCDALLEITGQGDQGWPLYMQSIIGSTAHIEALGSRLEKHASSASYAWGDDAIETLVRSRSFVAARIMDDKAQSTRINALRHRARSGVRRLAAEHNMSVDELLEAAMSTFGFDDDGARQFDYGSRTITVRLSSEGELLYEDDEGTRLKSMPQARKADDAALVKAARAEVSSLKKDLKRVRKNQTRRLEVSMATRRRWAPETWRNRYVEHPVMRAIAFGLVWGLYDEKDNLVTSFQLDDDGAPVDLDYETPTIGESARIGLVHPLELGEQKQAWLEALADYERVQPLNQLERPVFTKEEVGDLQKYLLSFKPVNPGAFLGRLNRLGYELGAREDAGLVFGSTRTFGDDVISISHDGLAPESLDYLDAAEVQSVSVYRDGTYIAVEELDPLFYSEIIHDISVLMEDDQA